MADPLLQADYSRCAALCCVVLPFDKSVAFGFSKAADEPCRHLAADLRCTIHDRLAQGFAGCIAFDCHGAGQRVTQQVFGGVTWRDNRALMSRMEAAFRAMRKLHEAGLLLEEAGKLPLSPEQAAEGRRLVGALDLGRDRDEAELAGLEPAQILLKVRSFLAGLRDLRGLSRR